MDKLGRIPIPRDLFDSIDAAAVALRDEYKVSLNPETRAALVKLNVTLAMLWPVDEVQNAS